MHVKVAQYLVRLGLIFPKSYLLQTLMILFFTSKHSNQEQNYEPNGSGSFTGAIGGPCNGHLSLSQVVVESSEEGQMKSSPWLSQTCAVSPKWNGFTKCVMCYVP